MTYYIILNKYNCLFKFLIVIIIIILIIKGLIILYHKTTKQSLGTIINVIFHPHNIEKIFIFNFETNYINVL